MLSGSGVRDGHRKAIVAAGDGLHRIGRRHRGDPAQDVVGLGVPVNGIAVKIRVPCALDTPLAVVLRVLIHIAAIKALRTDAYGAAQQVIKFANRRLAGGQRLGSLQNLLAKTIVTPA